MSAVRSSSEVVSEVFSEYVQCVSAVRFSVSIWHIMQTASEVVSEMFQYLNDVTLCVVFVYLGMMCVVFVYLVSSRMPDGVP